MERLRIGQLAKLANVNPEMIRYYGRRGMLPKPPRNQSGYRQYTREEVKRTDFIKRCPKKSAALMKI
jgi:MerR family mercuric resistance operon transcriptional regulator